MNLPDQCTDHAKRSGQVMQDWHTAEKKPMTRLPFKPHATHAGGWLKHSDCPIMLPPLSPAPVFWSQQGVRTHTHTHVHPCWVHNLVMRELASLVRHGSQGKGLSQRTHRHHCHGCGQHAHALRTIGCHCLGLGRLAGHAVVWPVGHWTWRGLVQHAKLYRTLCNKPEIRFSKIKIVCGNKP